MCDPSSLKNEKGHKEVTNAKESLRRGTLLGAASYALVAIANSVILPHQQSRRDAMGCDYLCLGSLSSARSALSLVGATIVGKLSDSTTLDEKLGGNKRKFVLVIGLLAAACAIISDHQASSISDLWVGIFPNALQQNLSVCKALLGEYQESIPGGVTTVDRAWSAGMLGMAAGFSLMIGPFVGAILLRTYQQAVAAGLCSLLLAALLVYLLPSPKIQPKNKNRQLKKGFLSFIDIPSARSPAALFLIGTKLLSALSFHIYQTIWSVYMKERLQFGPSEYGRFFSTIGFFYAISQGFLAKQCLERLGGENPRGRTLLLAFSSLLIGAARYAALHTTNSFAIYSIFSFKVTVYGVMSTIISADMSQIAAPEDLGSFFGLFTAVEAGAGMFGSLLGGALGHLHPSLPLIVVVGLNLSIFASALLSYERTVASHHDVCTEAKIKVH
jgi:MFS family permease